MTEVYTEADVKRFMQDALEAAAKRCEEMYAACKIAKESALDETARTWLESRMLAARDLAEKIRALEARPRR
jgi:isocitrate/isopropylmalate dehydrogenase